MIDLRRLGWLAKPTQPNALTCSSRFRPAPQRNKCRPGASVRCRESGRESANVPSHFGCAMMRRDTSDVTKRNDQPTPDLQRAAGLSHDSSNLDQSARLRARSPPLLLLAPGLWPKNQQSPLLGKRPIISNPSFQLLLVSHCCPANAPRISFGITSMVVGCNARKGAIISIIDPSARGNIKSRITARIPQPSAGLILIRYIARIAAQHSASQLAALKNSKRGNMLVCFRRVAICT